MTSVCIAISSAIAFCLEMNAYNIKGDYSEKTLKVFKLKYTGKINRK